MSKRIMDILYSRNDKKCETCVRLELLYLLGNRKNGAVYAFTYAETVSEVFLAALIFLGGVSV